MIRDTTANTISSLINPKIWNYGEAGYDHTHIFRVYWNYNIPRASTLVNSKIVKGMFDNWQISGIYTAQSGAPQAVSYSLLADAGYHRHVHRHRPSHRGGKPGAAEEPAKRQ